MSRTVLATSILLGAVSLQPVVAQQKVAQNEKPAKQEMKAMKSTGQESSKNSSDVLRAFFDAFGKGDMDKVIDSFHSETSIIAVRKEKRADNPLHGAYAGRQGAKDFISNLGKVFDTKAFSVAHVVSEGNIAFASGSFTHVLKTTGKPYTSDWALMCVVRDGKIAEYHFFEDSADFVRASN